MLGLSRGSRKAKDFPASRGSRKAKDFPAFLGGSRKAEAAARPPPPMGDEELRVMAASGHGCHVAAFVGGAWNHDFLHHFIVHGIGL